MKSILITLLLIMLSSCHGDYVEFGDDYVYVNGCIAKEDPKSSALDILVYVQVLNSAWDDDYIIAYQKPDRGVFEEYIEGLPQKEIDSLEHLYDRMHEIHNCYWIIRKKDKRVFGPMTKKDFEIKCRRMGVSIKLDPRYENQYI